MPLAMPAKARLSTALLIGGLTAAADQSSKLLAIHFLSPGQPVNLIGETLRLNLIYNPGMAFGIPLRGILYSGLLGLFLILALAVFIFKKESLSFAGGRSRFSSPTPVVTAIGLGLGGAVSNLADRIRLGAVVDYIDLGFWPVFNMADTALTIAAVLLVLSIFGGKKEVKG
jgi:signal peptidase II